MALANGAHVNIDGIDFLLDEAYESDLGRRCYSHAGRSIFAEQFTITGRPGAQNIRAKDLKWHLTNFSGGGQVVLDNEDPDSAERFYYSEGLNFRVPGQMSLNKSMITQYPAIGAPSATTYEGNASMEDVTGTSATSGTDRELDTVGDKVQTNANHAPGATNVQVDFYLYRDPFSGYATTIQGSAFTLVNGKGTATGSDFKLRDGKAWSAKLATGTAFTAGVPQDVRFTTTAFVAPVALLVQDVTNPDNIKTVAQVDAFRFIGDAPTTFSTTFTPQSGKTYRFAFKATQDLDKLDTSVTLDKVEYGPQAGNNLATIEVYNLTNTATVATKVVTVTSESAGNKVGSIVFTGTAAKNYRYRVARTSGPQSVWVDKVIASIQTSTTIYTLDDVELGLGGTIWLAGHAAGANSKVWTYDVTNDDWDEKAELNDGAVTTNYTVRATDHSDKFQYFLVSDGSTNNEVYTVASDGTDDRYAYFSANQRSLVGMCVAQNRLFLMAEDSTGVRIYSLPLDDTSTNPWNLNDAALSTGVQYVDIDAGNKTPDTTLRQRMVGSHTGARFFINYGDVTPRVYNCDSSGSVLQVTELAPLDTALKITAIAFTGGVTLLAGQYQSETDATPESVVWAIEANGVPERIGFLQEPGGEVEWAPIFMVPYQTDVYILQGNHIWRYSIGFTGGLYREYQLQTSEQANARAIAVNQGRIFVAYTPEIWVTGSEGTYRQAGPSSLANSFISSIYDFGLPGITKSLNKITLLTDTLDSSYQRVKVYYELDDSGTETLLGITGSGAQHDFVPTAATTFTAINIRLVLESLDGTLTPTVRGAVVSASALDQEEYFDLVLRTENEVAGDRISGEQISGTAKLRALQSSWKAGTPVNLITGYESPDPRDAESYRCLIEDFRTELNKVGEGRVVVTLRVI